MSESLEIYATEGGTYAPTAPAYMALSISQNQKMYPVDLPDAAVMNTMSPYTRSAVLKLVSHTRGSRVALTLFACAYSIHPW